MVFCFFPIFPNILLKSGTCFGAALCMIVSQLRVEEIFQDIKYHPLKLTCKQVTYSLVSGKGDVSSRISDMRHRYTNVY
jgi:hypothetical protein